MVSSTGLTYLFFVKKGLEQVNFHFLVRWSKGAGANHTNTFCNLLALTHKKMIHLLKRFWDIFLLSIYKIPFFLKAWISDFLRKKLHWIGPCSRKKWELNQNRFKSYWNLTKLSYNKQSSSKIGWKVISFYLLLKLDLQTLSSRA